MNTATLYPRLIQARLKEALADTPAVLLAGPRQSGKATLVRQLASEPGVRYLTLDDELTLLSARQDPTGMIRSLDRAVIDEIQRAPQLLLAIKKSVDEHLVYFVGRLVVPARCRLTAPVRRTRAGAARHYCSNEGQFRRISSEFI